MQEEVAKEFGIPVQFQRFWIWAKRQNHTYRPNRPLTPQEEAQTVNTELMILLVKVDLNSCKSCAASCYSLICDLKNLSQKLSG